MYAETIRRRRIKALAKAWVVLVRQATPVLFELPLKPYYTELRKQSRRPARDQLCLVVTALCHLPIPGVFGFLTLPFDSAYSYLRAPYI